MKKVITLSIIMILIILLFYTPLQGKPLRLRLIFTSAAYYPEYPDYDYDSPVLGFNANADIMNVYNSVGIGGSCFYKLTTYNDYFLDLQYYEAYLHNFFNYEDKPGYFIYGFFAGVKKTDLLYWDYKNKEKYNVEMIRPLLGFHFASNNWGITFKWTQTENKKPKLEYGLKFKNSIGLTVQIGMSNKGPIKGVKTDFHIYAGYEFFL